MATIQYVVNAVDAASATFTRIAATADTLNNQLDELAHKSATARVGLAGDKEAQASLTNIDLKLARLGKRIAKPDVTVEGLAAARLGIMRLDVALDRLDRKTVTVDVDWRGRIGRFLFASGGGVGNAFRQLFGGGAGGAGSKAAATGGILGGLQNALPVTGQAALYGGLGLLAATLGPALIPTLLGGAIGGAGAFGGLAIGSKDLAQLQTLRKQLAGVTGTTPASQAARARIQGQITAFRQANLPQIAFGRQAAALTGTVESTFFGALTTRPVIRPGGTGPGTHQQVLGQSFLQGLIPIFQQLGKFIKSMGPQLGDLFRASLPFLKEFVKVLEAAAKTILPAITQSLKDMAPSLPLITHGFVILIEGIARMIQAIGPRGMKAAAKLFVDLMRIMTFALQTLGQFMNGAAVTVQYVAHVFHQQWDEVRHRTADAFDRIRHDIADFAHNIAVWFDRIRHFVAASWDATWNDTIGRVKSSIGTVVTWVKGMPAKILSVLRGLGHSLASFMSAAFTEMLNAMKNVGKTIWGWLTSWVSAIPGFLKKILGIKSPSSVFYNIGKQMMMGLFHGIQDHANQARNAAQRAVSSAPGGLGGPASASAAQAQAYARGRLGAYGWGFNQFQSLVNLWNGESGWNRFARNPSSGAYGIPQALPPGKMGAAANPPQSSAAAQINWGMGYIRAVYGSPNAAYGAWLSRSPHWYDRGGWLPPGATLAVNTTGAPERVVSGRTDMAMLSSLHRIEALLADGPYRTAAGVGDAVSGASRQAAKSARYSARPR